MGLSYITFIVLRNVPSIRICWEFLPQRNVEFYSMLFLHPLNWWGNFVLHSVVIFTFVDLHMLAHLTRSWCRVFLMYCWIRLAFYWGFSHRHSPGILPYSLLCLSLVLVSEWWWSCRMSLEVFMSSIIWKIWEDLLFVFQSLLRVSSEDIGSLTFLLLGDFLLQIYSSQSLSEHTDF